MTMTYGPFCLAAFRQRRLKFGDRADLDRDRPHRRGVGGEVDSGGLFMDRMIQQVVELRPAGAHLQPVDAAEAAVVGDARR